MSIKNITREEMQNIHFWWIGGGGKGWESLKVDKQGGRGGGGWIKEILYMNIVKPNLMDKP